MEHIIDLYHKITKNALTLILLLVQWKVVIQV